MATFTKTYFLCPTSEFIQAPPAGPLRLGSLLRSTATPQYPLNATCNIPLAQDSTSFVETAWKKTVSAEMALGLGVYAEFLRLGLGPEASADHSNQASSVFAFDAITTSSFDPEPQYVKEAIKAPAVQAYLKERKQRFAPTVSLYLVTGLKLVKGANIKYSTSSSTDVKANIGINVAPLGLTIGPKGHWTRKSDNETEFNRESDFVFAFRVKRLKFGLRRKLEAEDYTTGAFLTTGEEADDSEQEACLMDNVDGSSSANASFVSDATEGESVYCIPA
ncbi:uncharacterized protein F5Z01DRAFT_103344 [Emericellopsis atlantica]|uniref:Uncharacterized protein n=1 Tax=Emericellopsis atlantica TaxID=2614577 RepID=A0A9P7ZMG3_9HYPO|nr:uncharacterized protein F5Z01DRAFT_103344 [Emericellopsis atlantica]KAG9254376.1 hypothetical protein F5Z01DRAFT_103344 [Emericellopsis atlantica]